MEESRLPADRGSFTGSGIGANTAIFSLIDSIMLKSLPVHNPEELISIGEPSAIGSVQGGSGGDVNIFSYPFYKRFREQNGVFADVYATGPSKRLNVEDSAERPLARFVSENYFSVLGVSPWLGRTFTKGEQPVVVISYAYWERHFQRAPDVIGRKLRINGVSFAIIGVTPREFFGDIVGYQSDIWFPIDALPLAHPGSDYLNDPKTQWLLLMGRLTPGVSLAQASAVTNNVGLQILKEQDPSATRDDLKVLATKRIPVQRAAGGFSRIRHSFSKPLYMLMILVALVLLICCINVANLQLARATSRAREIGLRLAIGASRLRLLRQLMTESLVLAVMGGVAGLFFSVLVGHLLLGLVARNNRLPLDFHLSGTTLLFTLGLCIAASFFFGLAPAIYATKASVAATLRASKSGRSHGGQHFEKGLVVFQIVLSWVLLFGSGLFIRTLQNLENIDVGYRRDQLVVVELDPVASGYHDQRLVQLAARLSEQMKTAPGISSASISENGLFSGTESISGISVQGFKPRSNDDQMSHSDRVFPGYFETIGTPLLAGRSIEQRDMGNSPRVAVLNESMARFYFPNVSPVGRQISTDEGKTWISVVGVVRDAKQNSLRDPPARRFYSQFAISKDDPIGSIKLELRTRASAAEAETLIRSQVRSVDPNLQIDSISSAQNLIDDDLTEERLIAQLSGIQPARAGPGRNRIVWRDVGSDAEAIHGDGNPHGAGREPKQRSGHGSEGHTAGDRDGVGYWHGCVGFLSEVSFKQPLRFGDIRPLTALLASVCIVAAAFLAGWLPARRASRVDPMVALRVE